MLQHRRQGSTDGKDSGDSKGRTHGKSSVGTGSIGFNGSSGGTGDIGGTGSTGSNHCKSADHGHGKSHHHGQPPPPQRTTTATARATTRTTSRNRATQPLAPPGPAAFPCRGGAGATGEGGFCNEQVAAAAAGGRR